MLFGSEAEAPTPPNKRRAVSSRAGATSGSTPLLVSAAALQGFASGIDQLKQVNSKPMLERVPQHPLRISSVKLWPPSSNSRLCWHPCLMLQMLQEMAYLK